MSEANDCIFCKIIKGKVDTEFLVKNKNLAVFEDIKPKAPVHYLIVSREHIETLDDIQNENRELLGDMILTGKKMAEKLNIQGNYKLVFNVGERGGQEVFHIHLHLLGGWK